MPIQWAAWLRKTRLDAPSMDELQADRIRSMKLQDNVAKLAEAYQEEKARIAASEQANIASASGIQAPGSEPSLEHQRKHEQPPASKEEALAEESSRTNAGPSAAAEGTKQSAAEESVKQIPKEQDKPSEDADRPGAQALKQSPGVWFTHTVNFIIV